MALCFASALLAVKRKECHLQVSSVLSFCRRFLQVVLAEISLFLQVCRIHFVCQWKVLVMEHKQIGPFNEDMYLCCSREAESEIYVDLQGEMRESQACSDKNERSRKRESFHMDSILSAQNFCIRFIMPFVMLKHDRKFLPSTLWRKYMICVRAHVSRS